MMFKLYCVDTEITKYLTECTWSGDTEQAGRKLNFSLAFNPYDKDFSPANVKLGKDIRLVYSDNNKELNLFTGKIFMMDRKSNSYTVEYVAYDKVIYLAKSKITAKYEDSKVSDIIAHVCRTMGVTMGEVHADLLGNTVSFVADNMAGTEIIKKALEELKSKTWHGYHIVLLQGALKVVRDDEKIETFKIKAGQNLISVSHSASIEDMVNKVQIVDKDGTVKGYVSNDNDISDYGCISTVYKEDEKKETQSAAKAMLKPVKQNTSLSAIGNVQCVAGFGVELWAEDESIKAKFRIKSDSHKIHNNQHEMDLTLEYLEEIK